MSVIPQIAPHAISVNTLSSFARDISPQKVTSREISQERIDEPIQIAKPSISIYADTQCFIEKTT